MHNKLFLALMLGTMLLIFFFSSHNEKITYSLSGSVTKGINNAVSELTSKNSEKSLLKKYLSEYYIRKAAHIFLYLLLAFFAMGFFYRNKIIFACIFTVITAFLYAVSDELHQNFIDGRFCSFKDVLIDMTGVFIGILIFLFINIIILYKKRK